MIVFFTDNQIAETAEYLESRITGYPVIPYLSTLSHRDLEQTQKVLLGSNNREFHLKNREEGIMKIRVSITWFWPFYLYSIILPLTSNKR